MPSIAVVSACYGNHDQVIPPPEMPGVEFVMVSDAGPWQAALGWNWIHEPRPHLHPRMAAKYPKCFPWLYAPHAEVVIWADASVEFKPGCDLPGLVGLLGDPGRVAMWKHPWRDDVRDEADVSREMPKYTRQPVIAQVQHYVRCEMPPDYGLWATGFAVYTGQTWDNPVQLAVAYDWLAEQVRWTYQDQLSLPYVCWRNDVRPVDIPVGWHLDNPWLTFRNHRSDA